MSSTPAADNGAGGTVKLIMPSDDAPAPEGLELAPDVVSGGVYQARPDQLDAWYSSSWTFRWRGEPFWMMVAGGGEISGHYSGGNGAFASERLERMGANEYEGSSPWTT